MANLFKRWTVTGKSIAVAALLPIAISIQFVWFGATEASLTKTMIPIIWSASPDYKMTPDENMNLVIVINFNLHSQCFNLYDPVERAYCFAKTQSTIIGPLESLCTSTQDFNNDILDMGYKFRLNFRLDGSMPKFNKKKRSFISGNRKFQQFVPNFLKSNLHDFKKYNMLSPEINYDQLFDLYEKQPVNRKIIQDALKGSDFKYCNFNGYTGQFYFKKPIKQMNNFRILHASPFTFYNYNGLDDSDLHSQVPQAVQYIGPKAVAYWSDGATNCIIHLDRNDLEVQGNQLQTDSECQSWNEIPVWKSSCGESSESIIQVKIVGSQHFIYCYGFSIRILETAKLCPEHVLSVHTENYEFFPNGTISVQNLFNNSDLVLTNNINVNLMGSSADSLAQVKNQTASNCTAEKVVVAGGNAKPVLMALGGSGVALAGVAGAIKGAENRGGGSQEQDEEDQEGAEERAEDRLRPGDENEEGAEDRPGDENEDDEEAPLLPVEDRPGDENEDDEEAPLLPAEIPENLERQLAILQQPRSRFQPAQDGQSFARLLAFMLTSLQNYYYQFARRKYKRIEL